MALKAAIFAATLIRFPGINSSELQEGPYLVDVPDSMADNDTTELTFPAEGDLDLPPSSVEVYTHTGGDLTNGVDDNWNVSAGDTLIFEIDTAGYDLARLPSELKAGRKRITHSLAGGTDTAYTSAQVAASIKADKTLSEYVYPVAELTANRVTLFPKKPKVKFNIIGGSAQTVLQFPAGDADWGARVYASQANTIAGGTGWTWSYGPGRVLTIKNETGGAVPRVMAIVRR